MNKAGTISAPAGISLDIILGRWSVTRVILDRKGMGKVVFDGTATIDRDTFDEHGKTLLNGFCSQSRRSYRLQFSKERVIVQFPDARDFIEIDGRAVQHVRHECGDDTYSGRFFFISLVDWAEVWRVTGPRKNYRSIARYTRL